jgi:hypothetical protein
MAKRKTKKLRDRNHVVVVARARNSAGPMRDRRKRREKEKARKELAQWQTT